jgi:hypothetical protein
MANAAVYITWGNAIEGRETKSLEVFGEALQRHATWKKEGKIEDHKTYVATTGDYERFSGCIVLEGEVAKLRALIDADDWKLLELRARHVVHNLQVVHCISGNEIPKYIELMTTARSQVGIKT